MKIPCAWSMLYLEINGNMVIMALGYHRRKIVENGQVMEDEGKKREDQ